MCTQDKIVLPPSFAVHGLIREGLRKERESRRIRTQAAKIEALIDRNPRVKSRPYKREELGPE